LSDEIRCLAESVAANPPAAHHLEADFIRSIIKVRQARAKFVGDGLFGDPAWDMLLDLMAARLEGRVVTVSSLCIASGVPPSTAMRWLTILYDRGLCVRRPDEDDGRRVLVELSDPAAASLHNYLIFVRARSLAAI
jgi:DNA-binding transcriptional ArsR family regulator